MCLLTVSRRLLANYIAIFLLECIPLKSVFLSPAPISLGGSYSVQLFFHSAFPLDQQYLHNIFGGKELLKYSFCFNDRTAYAVTPPSIFKVVIMLSTYLRTVFFHQGSLCNNTPTSFSFGSGGCKQGTWKPKRYRLQLRQESGMVTDPKSQTQK